MPEETEQGKYGERLLRTHALNRTLEISEVQDVLEGRLILLPTGTALPDSKIPTKEIEKDD